MKSEWDKGFSVAFAMGLVAICILTVAGVIQTTMAENREWAHGWCSANGGVVITEQVCNVNDRLVTIPERP